ncbi:MAG: RagB/SusD family nutrient uptake outer membrane protein [Bacteroidales bacterium]|nr:RagB/SusD family nutrient uptake outer membrane protein [Bacteroidales bacterium]
MKKIFCSITVAAVLVGATSCSDFLEEDNKTSESAELAYSTETGIAGLVNSCYAFTRGWWGKEAGLGLTEAGTDLFLAGYDNKQKSLVKYNFTATSLDGNTSDDPCLDHYWELFYCAVDVCNNALYYIDRNDIISDETKAQYRGEVYFLRALYYLQMVATWGPIPYNSERITSVSTTPTRMPEAEVYKNILADIELSLTNFKEANFTSKTAHGGLKAKATYYAAQALKARTALYAASWLGADAVEGYSNLYTTAKEAAQDVINNAGASFYARYSDVWNLNNEAVQDNSEAIWGVYYNNELSTDNCIPYRYKTDDDGDHLKYNSLITRTGYSRGGSAMNLMFVSMWSNGVKQDGLGGNSTKSNNLFVRVLGSSTSYVVSAKTGNNVTVDKYYSPYGRGFTRYLPSLYLWRELETVRATDQRADGTLLTHYNCPADLEDNAAAYYPNMGEHMTDPEVAYETDGNYFNAGDTAIYYSVLDGDSEEGKALQAYATGRYRLQFASGGDIPVYSSGDVATAVPTETAKAVSAVYGDARYNNVNVGGWKSYPGIKKFHDDQYNESYPTHDITYRDAIVFRLPEMYLIVAECQLANGDASAALSTLNILRSARAVSGTDNSLSGTPDINTILHERALELCGEQQRWFDLKRTHKLIEYVQARNGQASANIELRHYYRPIPEAQMEACTNVVSASASQNSDGVLNYSAEQEGFWQNPGW